MCVHVCVCVHLDIYVLVPGLVRAGVSVYNYCKKDGVGLSCISPHYRHKSLGPFSPFSLQIPERWPLYSVGCNHTQDVTVLID